MGTLPRKIIYSNGKITVTLGRNQGLRIVDFDVDSLRLALATSVNKRSRDRIGFWLHAQRLGDGRSIEYAAYPEAGTFSSLPDTTEEYYLFESRMTHPKHDRLYVCLVDLAPKSRNPGHIWRIKG